MNIQNRLSLVIENLHITQSVFAQKIGVSHKSLTNWLAGTNEPGTQAILAMFVAFQINPNWLLLGKGEMFYSSDAKNFKANPLLYHSFISLLPSFKNQIVDAIFNETLEIYNETQNIQSDFSQAASIQLKKHIRNIHLYNKILEHREDALDNDEFFKEYYHLRDYIVKSVDSKTHKEIVDEYAKLHHDFHSKYTLAEIEVKLREPQNLKVLSSEIEQKIAKEKTFIKKIISDEIATASFLQHIKGSVSLP